MPIIDNKILTPITNIANLSRKPTPSETLTYQALQALFDKGSEDLRVKLNSLIDALLSVATDSGAKNIGNKTIAGLTGNDLQTTIEALKILVDAKANTLNVYSKSELNTGALDSLYMSLSNAYTKLQVDAIVQGVVLGQISDGSITDIKLSNAVGDIKERLATSLADLSSQVSGKGASLIGLNDSTNKFTATNVEGAMLELFTSANDGKIAVASAITAKGVTASSADTFPTLATKVGQIQQGHGNAIASDLLLGKTASSDVGDITGTKDLSNLISGNIKAGINIDGTVGTLSGVQPGTTLISNLNTQQAVKTATPTKTKEAQVSAFGTYRVSMQIWTNTSSKAITGQIYVNDIPKGILRTMSSLTPTIYTEDFIVNINDKISLYMCSLSTGSYVVDNMTIGVTYPTATNLLN